jgi:hypothetical protein
VIRDFLGRVAKIPMDEMEDQEILQTLQSLKKEVEAANNPYVKDLLTELS